ncbi:MULTISPECIES: IS66 family insertion sequence element accessory protein TnpB [Klebsiella]|jgi:transposase|nr:IS66 family insertion sequence element accessory protein TnpB [Klebsiella michiganensis]WAT43029.1 IS66 family insertion sequence element accessory protein TnpB [Klebsiella michiganensis]HBQ5882086.1 IS66 family insertion sequence element accessory protein TnpB [Klebsiella pneumoniae subsp. pneumoniae]
MRDLILQLSKSSIYSTKPFRGHSGSQVKLHWSTGDGRCPLTKRLEHGRYAWLSACDGKVFLTPAQLAMLMEGIDWRQPKRLLTFLTML